MSDGDERKVDELTVTTSLGTLAAKGIRVSDILSLVIAAVLALLLYILYTHKTDAKEAAELIAKAIQAQGEATVAATKAQNLQTCIMAMDIDKREKAYDDKNSWCNRVFGLK